MKRTSARTATSSPTYRPLSRLVLELVLAASAGELITELRITPLGVELQRGPAALDPVSFALDDHVPDHFGLLAD